MSSHIDKLHLTLQDSLSLCLNTNNIQVFLLWESPYCIHLILIAVSLVLPGWAKTTVRMVSVALVNTFFGLFRPLINILRRFKFHKLCTMSAHVSTILFLGVESIIRIKNELLFKKTFKVNMEYLLSQTKRACDRHITKICYSYLNGLQYILDFVVIMNRNKILTFHAWATINTCFSDEMMTCISTSLLLHAGWCYSTTG